MKATIDACGNLIVIPETGIEAYAISQWARANLPEQSNVIVDCSDFPSMIGLPPSVNNDGFSRMPPFHPTDRP